MGMSKSYCKHIEMTFNDSSAFNQLSLYIAGMSYIPL